MLYNVLYNVLHNTKQVLYSKIVIDITCYITNVLYIMLYNARAAEGAGAGHRRGGCLPKAGAPGHFGQDPGLAARDPGLDHEKGIL